MNRIKIFMLLMIACMLTACGRKEEAPKAVDTLANIEHSQIEETSVPEGKIVPKVHPVVEFGDNDVIDPVLFLTTETQYGFVLEGKQYTFPMELASLVDDGWSYDNDVASQTLESGLYSSILLTKEDKEVTVSMLNKTATPIAVDECSMVGVTASILPWEEDANISFADITGCTLGMTQPEIEDILGEPDEYDEASAIAKYNERVEGSIIATVSFVYNCGTVKSISISYLGK